MDLTSTQFDKVQVVTVNAARIDAAVAIRFKDIMRGMTEFGPERIVLDLSQVEFVDSSGLGAIVASMKQLGSSSKLDLAGLTPTVDKVFRLTRMDTIFAIHDSADAAVAEYTH
ncbi:MAG: STAS domain-containing protein [Rhodobacterales bacterium]|nr:STAS domain-containing protein [Rhodobacterales bacterium]